MLKRNIFLSALWYYDQRHQRWNCGCSDFQHCCEIYKWDWKVYLRVPSHKIHRFCSWCLCHPLQHSHKLLEMLVCVFCVFLIFIILFFSLLIWHACDNIWYYFLYVLSEEINIIIQILHEYLNTTKFSTLQDLFIDIDKFTQVYQNKFPCVWDSYIIYKVPHIITSKWDNAIKVCPNICSHASILNTT